ncbi:hypothetical protein PB01_02395 [Psychrobacillus glaciei]|uniref:Uncharacterized protein n=1 Tax=Psychrobacillus glaciei TaxID=2283160 RepID=A0A5J6SIS5_9BACI|nr:hypothetical protein [Psychrobacillus glaciei]QFF97751.1 hypothetical protein PB01_02395 [Psychrobacillus glaciei]
MDKTSEDRVHQHKKGHIPDNPDEVKTDKKSIFDMDKGMQTVDPIPVEELNEKVKDEKNKRETKSTSSSEERFPD